MARQLLQLRFIFTETSIMAKSWSGIREWVNNEPHDSETSEEPVIVNGNTLTVEGIEDAPKYVLCLSGLGAKLAALQTKTEKRGKFDNGATWTKSPDHRTDSWLISFWVTSDPKKGIHREFRATPLSKSKLPSSILLDAERIKQLDA